MALKNFIVVFALTLVTVAAFGLASCFQEAENKGPCDPYAFYEDGLRETVLGEAELPFATVDSIQAAQLLPTTTRSVEIRGGNTSIIDAIVAISTIEQIRFDASPGVFSGDMTKLAGMPNLRVLDLVGCEVTDAYFANLSTSASLRDLRVSNESGLTTTGMISLGNMTQLRRLQLANCGILDAWLSHIASITSLEYLDLASNASLTQTGLFHLKSMPNLKELSLRSCGLQNVAVAEVAQYPALEWLDLSSNSALTHQGIEPLASMATLRTLLVRDCGANSAWLGTFGLFTTLDELAFDGTFADTFFSGLGGMAAIKRLAIGGSSVTSPAMIHVAALTTLEQLDLSGTLVGDGGLGHLQNMPALRLLIVNSAGSIGSTGAAFISRMPALESLDLGGASANIGVSGFTSLSLSVGLRSLTLRNSGVSDDNLKLFRRQPTLRELTLVNESGLDGSFIATLVSSGTCLERLTFTGTSIAESNYRYVPQLRNLRRLTMSSPGGVSKLTLDRIANCPMLERFTLVSASQAAPGDFDTGIRNLTRLANLTRLDLRGTVTTRSAAIDYVRSQAPAVAVRYG